MDVNNIYFDDKSYDNYFTKNLLLSVQFIPGGKCLAGCIGTSPESLHLPLKWITVGYYLE